MRYGEVSSNGLAVRRRDKRIWFVVLGIFVSVFLFSFLVQRFKSNEEATAASLAGFDPGYIISDYQMGNYSSMSEAEIQAFLTAKNPCGNRDYDFYKSLSGATWHWENDHFVCLSEERFGDGEVIGLGDTAAHIIWQTAQDYKINPQVLLVLLQKETGLITDPIPNNLDYRKATGFGCPDTAACSSKYYGFKNQLRNAAALFRTVLDGGWTNYPLGNNYVQYNPNAACGGSVVNIRSLATSALYRYTPYQPNAGTLAAGYGTAYCGAYGNRNFYLYFEDWFGGITNAGYFKMDNPRYLQLKAAANKINPLSLDEVERLDAGRNIWFTTKILTSDGEVCLRSEYDTSRNNNTCIRIGDLEEFNGLSFLVMEKPRYLFVPSGTKVINSMNGTFTKTSSNKKVYFDMKSYWVGEMCLRSVEQSKIGAQSCILYKDLEEIMSKEIRYDEMEKPRLLKIKKDTVYYDSDVENKLSDRVESGDQFVFVEKIKTKNGLLCLRTLVDMQSSNNRCIIMDELEETINDSGREYVAMDKKRSFKLLDDGSYLYTSGYYYDDNVNGGDVMFFVDKTYVDNEICLRTNEDKKNDIARCVIMTSLMEDSEVQFMKMDNARMINAEADSMVIDFNNATKKEAGQPGGRYFVDKMIWNGKICVRTNEDAISNKSVCYVYDTLRDNY